MKFSSRAQKFTIASTLALCGLVVASRIAPAQNATLPFNTLPARAYHVMPGTHNNESGYFSLVEGIDGKIYVGTAKYGENSYLVEFDPKTEKQRIVLDTNKVSGATGRGFAAQSKLHTKNFVGPSGKVYVGSKEGYPSEEEKKANAIAPYPGGYVMTYDPKTGKTENLGMPWPGQGVGDVVADEARGLIYIVTCEDEYWMVYDTNTKKYRWLGPTLFDYASTIVDAQGRANSITKDYEMARWDPATNKLSTQPILVNGKPIGKPDGGGWIPNWAITPDKKTAYLIRMSHPEIFKLDLSGDMDKPITATMVGLAIDDPQSDSRSCISYGPDGKVYTAIAVVNKNKVGTPYQLTHVTRYDPQNGKMDDLGVLTVQNPDFFNFKADATGKTPPFSHGYGTLPDGTLTPQYQPLGSIVARDGSVYVLILYPYTLLRVTPNSIRAAQARPVPQTVAIDTPAQ